MLAAGLEPAPPDEHLLTALLCPGLDAQVFLLIGRTSALTLNIGGVAKDWLLIGLSVTLYHSVVSRLNLAGYLVSFLSVRIFPVAQAAALLVSG